MSYCFQPDCQNPHNEPSADRCQSCGASLLLKSRYRILHPLSRGTRHRTFVAIDRHRPSHPHCIVQQFSATARADFEATVERIEAVCEHSQLPDFFASFGDGGDWYQVQDYIEGTHLATEIETAGNQGDRQIQQLLAEILPVLQWMHEHDLVHGDLKPENLIRREADGKPILVDLGSVRTIRADGSASTAIPTGSAEYAAPEQLQGRVLPSSDLYSLGLICLRLMTHVSIFELFDSHENALTWRSHLKTRVNSRLGQILDRLIQPSLNDRYSSAAEVLADLPAIDRQPPIVRKVARWDYAATVGAGIALAVTALTCRSPAPTPNAALQTAPAPTPRLHNYPLHSRSGTTHTLSSAWGSVWSVATSPDGKLVVSGTTDGTIQVRKLTPACLNSGSCKPDRILLGHSGSVWAVAVSPDGRLLASASEDQTVKLWNLQTGHEIATLSPYAGEVFDVAFSPDSQTLASVGEDGTVRLWNTTVSDGQPSRISLRRTLSGHADEVKSVAFLPDGEHLVTASSDTTVKLWHVPTAEAVAQWQQSAAVWSVAVSPDGRTLATSTADGTIALLDVATGQPLKTIARQKLAHQSLAFSPNGQTLASADLHGTIELWRVRSGCRLGVLKQHSGWVDLAFSPDGRGLVSGSYDETIKLWQIPGSRGKGRH